MRPSQAIQHIMLIFENGGYQESDIVRVEKHVVEGWHDDQNVPPGAPGGSVSD